MQLRLLAPSLGTQRTGTACREKFRHQGRRSPETYRTVAIGSWQGPPASLVHDRAANLPKTSLPRHRRGKNAVEGSNRVFGNRVEITPTPGNGTHHRFHS